MNRKDIFAKKIRQYRKDPNLFFKEVTHFTPEPYQAEMAKDIAEFSKVSTKSGQGIGKTAWEANIALWFLVCFPNARIVATAPTMQQLNDVLWAEINKWISKSTLLKTLLTWTKTYVYLNGHERTWFAVAKTATKPENMQGFHEDNMLFIVDEASGVADDIMEAILGTLSGDNNKLALCGNPTRTTGTFYDSFHKDRALYRTHTVSSLESKRTNKENIEMLRRKYGEDSNFFKVRVLGEFPSQESDVFIPLSLIEKAVMTEISEDIGRISIGCDVARYGDDETIIATLAGNRIEIPIKRHGQNLMQTVGDLVQTYFAMIEKYPKYKGKISVNIDDTGVGGGVTDRLQEVKEEQELHRMEINPVNFAQKAPDSEHYGNIATYMWGMVRELLRLGELSITDDEELVAQLSVRKYGINSNGKIALESKDAMKKRGIRSPDRADAVALACYTQSKIYSSYAENAEKLNIKSDSINWAELQEVNIGISTKNGTAIVATGISKDTVYALKTLKEDEMETTVLAEKFYEMAVDIWKRYKKLSYVYIDKDETFVYQAIKAKVIEEKIPITLRLAMTDNIQNRVKLTAYLTERQKLKLTEDNLALNRALTSAERDDCTMNAFEYTVERQTRFLTER